MVPMVFELGGVDRTQIDDSCIRYGVTVRLPFRLRFSRLVRLQADSTHNGELCFWNEKPITSEMPEHDVSRHYFDDRRKLWTDSLVLMRPKKIDKQLLNGLRAGHGDEGSEYGLAVKDPMSYVDDALGIINRGIMAYQQATGNISGGELLHPVVPSYVHFQGRGLVICVCPTEYTLSDDDVLSILRRNIEREEHTRPGFWGELVDVDDISIASIEKIMQQHADHVYYEFAFLASSYFAQGQYVMGFLMAVVALESVHGIFLQVVAGNLIGNRMTREEIIKFLEDVMKDQGFYKMLPRTVKLFFGINDKRPTAEELRAFEKAVEMRNAFMHASIKADGPKLRRYAKADVVKAYNDIGKVFECFVMALNVRGHAMAEIVPGFREIVLSE